MEKLFASLVESRNQDLGFNFENSEGLRLAIENYDENGQAMTFPPENAKFNYKDYPYITLKEFDNNLKIRVMTFNILARNYDDKFTTNFKKKDDILPQHRCPHILDIITFDNPDFLALQEVDKPMMENLQELSKTYDLHYQQRASRPDGLWTGVRKQSFKILSSKVLDFNEEAAKCGFKDPAYNQFNIAVILLVQHIESKNVFVVANTHIYWNPKRDDIKYFQMITLMDYIVKHHKSTDNIVVLGDLNSKPTSNIAHLLVGMPPVVERLEVEATAKMSIGMEKKCFERFDLKSYLSFGFVNCFQTYKRLLKQDEHSKSTGEPLPPPSPSLSLTDFPEVTNYTLDFKDTLDHILIGRGLELVAFKTLPTKEDLKLVPGFPCVLFPSDHLPLVVDVVLNTN
jgi:mRNA deadenylase 3'-5' endonuclease subunit Ccr4